MEFWIEYQKKSDSISTIIMILHILIHWVLEKEMDSDFICSMI